MPAPRRITDVLTQPVCLRPVAPSDEAFLQELFLAARPELHLLPAQLIELQRRAQRGQYDRDFPGNVDHVVESDGPVGRCWGWPGAKEYRLLDLVIAPSHRGRGLGRSVLAELSARADRSRLPLRLSVWATNSDAIRLYRAAGFERYDEQNGYLLMQRPVGEVA